VPKVGIGFTNGQEFLVMRLMAGLFACWVGGFLAGQAADSSAGNKAADAPLRLGKFSVSLAVKDLAKSREFYEKLGFKVTGGDQLKNYLVLQNETATIGLFQGMFTKNMLTFVPGWDRANQPLADFDDVRDIQKTLKSRGLVLKTEADEASTGPASLIVVDPDGNPVAIDQYVPKPRK
jgi:catechol 2,3-dioxygenase-like lactoylglutathione lyase family enzyme